MAPAILPNNFDDQNKAKRPGCQRLFLLFFCLLAGELAEGAIVFIGCLFELPRQRPGREQYVIASKRIRLQDQKHEQN
jgi:hypothetical protein